jgi:hypothetical protein
MTAKEDPKWFQFRWRLSNQLMRLAQWIYPPNPNVQAFLMQQMYDQIFYGKSCVKIERVDPNELLKDSI